MKNNSYNNAHIINKRRKSSSFLSSMLRFSFFYLQHIRNGAAGLLFSAIIIMGCSFGCPACAASIFLLDRWNPKIQIELRHKISITKCFSEESKDNIGEIRWRCIGCSRLTFIGCLIKKWLLHGSTFIFRASKNFTSTKSFRKYLIGFHIFVFLCLLAGFGLKKHYIASGSWVLWPNIHCDVV